MSDLRDEIAEAILNSKVGFRMELIRLVDGESTYRLTYDDGESHDFVGDWEVDATDELYAHVEARKRYAQADAVLAVIARHSPLPTQEG